MLPLRQPNFRMHTSKWQIRLFILHSESKSLLLRMLSTSFVMLPSQVRQTTLVWCVRRPFSAPFLFFCLCFLNNVCPNPLIISSISTSSLKTLITKTLHSQIKTKKNKTSSKIAKRLHNGNKTTRQFKKQQDNSDRTRQFNIRGESQQGTRREQHQGRG